MWNKALSGLAAALLLGGCGAEPRTSILLVTLDTLRVDHVGAYGDGRGLTPNLDALAAEGLVHENAFTTMPTTSPAHISLFTGLYPLEHGVRRNGDPLVEKHADRQLAPRLRRAGYATAAFVATHHLRRQTLGIGGFEIYDAPTAVLRHGDEVVDATLAWLDAEKRRPVLLWVHLYDPHAPYGTPDEKRRSFPLDNRAYGFVDDRYDDRAVRLEMEQRYARGIRSGDAALGRLIAGVRERLDRPPLILVATDHGETLSEAIDDRGYGFDHGEHLDAHDVEIALLAVGPGVPVGRSVGAVSIRDLYTTLLAAAGLEDASADVEGRRDLRAASDARRIVRIERRVLDEAFRLPDSVYQNAGAATDGTHLVVVGSDGLSAAEGVTPVPDILAEARLALDDREARALAPLEPETEKALRDLGYLE